MAEGLLVIGVGNVLMGDDGVGPRLAVALQRDASLLPVGTRVIDGGTLGLSLLPVLDGAGTVLVLDALDTGSAPGTVTLLIGPACEGALGQPLSAHQLAVADLLAAARLIGFDGRIAMVGIQPCDVSPGVELSPAVTVSFPAAVAAARRAAWLLFDPAAAS